MTLQRLWTNKHGLFIRLAPLAAMMLFLANLLMADVTGNILGTVTDPSGAVVPGATVTLRHASTGLRVTTTTNAVGGYQFLAVPVGAGYAVEWKLQDEATGFRQASETGIKLLVNHGYRVDFQLQVGATTQVVSVSASAVQVETTNTQLGDVIEDRRMTSLPLNGRSYIDLLGLQAGVVPIASTSSNLSILTNNVSGKGFSGLLSVNGSREAANAFLVNGGDVEESQNNGAAIAPTFDSIQEFRLLSGTFDAEYGRFSGAMVNVITKSGTNDLRGSLYEFLRNEKLDARNFFDRNQSDPISGLSLPR